MIWKKESKNKMLKLYGLKQAPKQWHEKFNETLHVDIFSSSDANKCVYRKYVNDDHVDPKNFFYLGLVHIACYIRSDALHLMLTHKFSFIY